MTWIVNLTAKLTKFIQLVILAHGCYEVSDASSTKSSIYTRSQSLLSSDTSYDPCTTASYWLTLHMRRFGPSALAILGSIASLVGQANADLKGVFAHYMVCR